MMEEQQALRMRYAGGSQTRTRQVGVRSRSGTVARHARDSLAQPVIWTPAGPPASSSGKCGTKQATATYFVRGTRAEAGTGFRFPKGGVTVYALQ